MRPGNEMPDPSDTDLVMPGRDPGIHTAMQLARSRRHRLMDCRVDPRIKSGDGNDEGGRAGAEAQTADP